MREGEFTQEWLWRVESDNGPFLGTGSISAAYKGAYNLLAKGEQNVCIVTPGGVRVEIKERRSQTPGDADLAGERINTCEGYDPERPRGRDAHPVYGPDALQEEAGSHGEWSGRNP